MPSQPEKSYLIGGNALGAFRLKGGAVEDLGVCLDHLEMMATPQQWEAAATTANGESGRWYSVSIQQLFTLWSPGTPAWKKYALRFHIWKHHKADPPQAA